MADFTIRDNNTKLRVTCLKRDGSPYNLIGYTLQIRYRIGSVDHSLRNMTVVDAPNGIVEYDFSSGSGIVITVAVNDRLDVDLDVTSPGVQVLTIPPTTYTTIQDLVDALEILCQAEFFFSHCILESGRIKLYSFGFPIQTNFATGPNFARSAAVTLGFLPTDVDLGLEYRIAEGPPVILQPDDLSEQGIMYVEIEITETSTGKIVSSSDELIFVVRGKVTDG